MKDHESISLATRFTHGVGLVDISPPELQSRLSMCPQEANDFMNAGHYILYRESVGGPVRSCTIEEADDPAYKYYLRGIGFAEHMRTHAESVILDLEKCVAINPAYRHRVEQVLAEARRTVAGFKR